MERMMNKEWKMVKLGDCTSMYQPKTISQEEMIADGEYLVYGANGVIGRYDKYNHETPQLLVTCRGATCGTINVSAPYSWITGNSMVVAPNVELLDFDYLKYYLCKDSIMDNIITGAAQPQITRTNLAQLQVYFPNSLATQQQIAKTLDKASDLIQKRKAQLAELDALAESIFYDMFGDPVTNEKGWDVCKIGDVLNSIDSGVSVGGEQRNIKSDEIGILKVSAVTSGYFRCEEYKVIPENTFLSKHIIPNKGDLLFSRANTKDLVGATCIVWDNYPNLRLPDKLWRLNLNNTANNLYAKYILSDRDIRLKFTLESTGTSGSMYNISMPKLKGISIPLPPLPLQQQFAERIEKIEEQKQKVKAALKESEDLFQRLMQDMFKPENDR